jgi:DNA-binding NarL/FixJ family response regulator
VKSKRETTTPPTADGEPGGAQDRVRHDLQERVKELQCLYGLAQLAERCHHDLDRLMQGAAELLVESWQYPEVTCARILYDGAEYRSSGFRSSRYVQAAPIHLDDEEVGRVEVYYTRKMPPSDEGPFLKEERALIDAVAERLARAIERLKAEQELRTAHAQLQVERKALRDSNSALRTVLARIEDEKNDIKQAIVANVDRILLPILHALEAEIRPDQRGYVRLLRYNLEEIASPLVDRLSRKALALTPAEIAVCGMIKMGMSTKEIASLRNVSPATVSRQRENIRRKLGLANKGVNLATFLQTFARSLPPARHKAGPMPPPGGAEDPRNPTA